MPCMGSEEAYTQQANMTQRQSAICRNRLRRKIERRKADASRRGKMGVEARRLEIHRTGPTWQVIRELTITDPRTGFTNYWTISATNDPRATIGLCINGTWSKIVSERSLRSLLAKHIWRLA